jgi:hypothetical protein
VLSGEAAFLLSARAVRARAQAMLLLAGGDASSFTVDWNRWPALVERVVATIRAHHPDPRAIPPHSRWRHFDAGGVDRVAALDHHLASLPADEALRARFDLAVTSVLLDAGAGPRWRYVEPGTGLVFGRSEGLAVASFHMFMEGAFASAPQLAPLRADPGRLEAMDEDTLVRCFQVRSDNPLVGVPGRVTLLRRLGRALREGHLVDRVRARVSDGALAAETLLSVVLETLGPIWPGRHSVEGVNLGDTWPHPVLGLVPFHKLSQWLTYSLLEPLEAAGVRVSQLDGLTGLAEYRNGGLFLDGGVVVPKEAELLEARHRVEDPAIVEWRGLTVALLDRMAESLRKALMVRAQELPLARVLEGGTWRAGRDLAAERRPDATPPLTIESDGTVF